MPWCWCDAGLLSHDDISILDIDERDTIMWHRPASQSIMAYPKMLSPMPMLWVNTSLPTSTISPRSQATPPAHKQPLLHTNANQSPKLKPWDAHEPTQSSPVENNRLSNVQSKSSTPKPYTLQKIGMLLNPSTTVYRYKHLLFHLIQHPEQLSCPPKP